MEQQIRRSAECTAARRWAASRRDESIDESAARTVEAQHVSNSKIGDIQIAIRAEDQPTGQEKIAARSHERTDEGPGSAVVLQYATGYAATGGIEIAVG